MYRFIRQFIFFSFCAVFFALVAYRVHAQAEPQELRVVRVGVYNNPPKIYQDSAGILSGVYGDLLTYIARQENWKLEVVPGTFEEGLARVATGEIDLMTDVAFTEDRAQIYDFTQETVMGSWGALYVADTSEVESIQDLENKTIAILTSSVYETGPAGISQYVETLNMSVNLVEYDEYGQVFAAVAGGQADAAVVSRISAFSALREYPNLKSTEIIFSPTELRFALTKNGASTPYLIERLDFWVAQLRSERGGLYDQILQRHGLLEALSPQYQVAPAWVFPAAVAAAISLLASWGIILISRHSRLSAQRQLTAREQYLGKVITNVPVILATLNPKGEITFAAGRSLPIVFGDIIKLIGVSALELNKNNPVMLKNLQQALAGEERHFQAEISGHMFEVVASPINERGRIREVVVLAIDATEKIELEHARRGFMAMVQHQLRTPPGAIRWGIELLGPKVLPVLDDEEKQLWRALESEAVKLIDLANSFSLVMETEAGLLELKPESINLKELVAEIIAAHNELVAERDLKISHQYDETLSLVHDRTALATVLRALISNALHYTAPHTTVEITIQEKPDTIFVQVKDQGPGIPESEREKLFDRFYRGEPAVKLNPVGLGIGLPLAKSLTERIGGKIWYESKLGEGSTFFVELPKTISGKSADDAPAQG